LQTNLINPAGGLRIYVRRFLHHCLFHAGENLKWKIKETFSPDRFLYGRASLDSRLRGNDGIDVLIVVEPSLNWHSGQTRIHIYKEVV
jgi:hypothetical protein